MAALVELPKDLPVVLDGMGPLDLVQRGEERADRVGRGGFVEVGVEDNWPVSVVWLLGKERD